ncbi:hypothetical protein [Lichenihabitans psoromatis]|uniref:hypothetical protein n=1 Tax=Lichenihabitans psoromatis TaxID=2528642 RepID=UPI001036474D|nr:hypothetical protein [Lichenihabitans psoromatis]
MMRLEEKAKGRRVMDIEDVLRWVYRDELPKRQREGDGGEPCEVSPMFRICDLGVRVDDWSREPGLPAALGECHPDALKVEAAVNALARFHDEPISGPLDLAPDFVTTAQDEAQAMRRGFERIEVTIGIMARMPAARCRPFWQSRPTQSRVTQPNGKPVVLRWETQFVPVWPEGELAQDVLVPVAPSGQHYPQGAYCPLKYDQEPKSILEERAEYLAWWAGLNALAGDLFEVLESIAVLPPSAAQKPWLGETDAGKPPRIFADLSARMYRKDDRETAAAHRALGMRRLSPARRGAPAVPLAIRPAKRVSEAWLARAVRPAHSA